MTVTTKTRIMKAVLALLMFVSGMFGQGNLPEFSIYAQAASIPYDESSVMDDLTSSGSFNLNDYPYDSTGTPQIINFVEYCYSFRKNLQHNYGLYVYVYNPTNLDVDTESFSNKIQIAVSYDNAGNPTSYEKFRLRFLSKSTGESKNLFYKFKVVEREIKGTLKRERICISKDILPLRRTNRLRQAFTK